MNRRGRRGLAALLAALVLTLSLSGCGGRRLWYEKPPLDWTDSDWTMAEGSVKDFSQNGLQALA